MESKPASALEISLALRHATDRVERSSTVSTDGWLLEDAAETIEGLFNECTALRQAAAQAARDRDETLGYHAHAAAAYETSVAEIKALRGERDILLNDIDRLQSRLEVHEELAAWFRRQADAASDMGDTVCRVRLEKVYEAVKALSGAQ